MARLPRRLAVRPRARLYPDERGFTLIETIIAITVIFSALLALAYTATIGFGYESLARQKLTATGIADQIMEQVRGLAWDRITAGHLSTDLTGDTNLVTGCGGDPAGIYRYLSCTAGALPGSGEKVVAQAQPCPVNSPDCVYPLVRHSGQITQNNMAYTWKTYDTNNCPTSTSAGCTATTPYRLTVTVTWTGGRTAPNKIVQVQSLFWSPGGCRSTDTHPFAAPCQPFFYGVANLPRGSVNITGSISQTSFSSGDLFTSGVQSSVQQEQLSQVQGGFTQSGVRLVDDSGTQTAGGTIAATSAADTDPGTASTTYSAVRCGDVGYPCSGGSVSTGSANSMTLVAPSSETAESDSTTSAGGTNVCPPPSDTAQADQKACGGSRIQQGGALSAVLSLAGTDPALGSASIAGIAAAPNSPNKTFVDRVQNPSSSLCAPVANADGCVEETATRVLGILNVGALPSAVSAPGGWGGASPWQGSYFSIVGYQGSVSAAVGTNGPSPAPLPPPPSATVNSGTVYCWNGTNGYRSASATSSSVSSLCSPFTSTQVSGGHTVTVSISASTTNPASVTTTSTAPSGTTTRTDATVQVVPPQATILYIITVDGGEVVHLTITVNLNTLEARGVYAVAPTQNS
jgi:prepilin-type N-terminal cleavage/methylation domain-containing protein